mmetsp:Transcript_7989/g.22312  ORF Transcript_7989/g.22312 Transcript_7989/m.22312 type:complete len:226 (-) Transcript_7989:67-744(-)
MNLCLGRGDVGHSMFDLGENAKQAAIRIFGRHSGTVCCGIYQHTQLNHLQLILCSGCRLADGHPLVDIGLDINGEVAQHRRGVQCRWDGTSQKDSTRREDGENAHYKCAAQPALSEGGTLLGLHGGVLLIHLPGGTPDPLLALDLEEKEVAGPQEEEEHDEAGKCQDTGFVVLGLDFVGRKKLGKVGSVTESRCVVHLNDNSIVNILAVLVSVHDASIHLFIPVE